jgi:hypothetical protein
MEGVIFPYVAAPRVSSNASFVDGFCSNAKGKTWINMNNSQIYDISACDILDEDLDVIYAYNRNGIYTQNTAMSDHFYWYLIIVTIYLVRALSLTILNKLHKNITTEDEYQYKKVIIITCTIIFIFVDGDKYYVTNEDVLLYWISIVYAGFYCVFHIFHSIRHWHNKGDYVEPRVINASTVTLQLIIGRLYQSMETQYSVLIILMFATRIWEKLLFPKNVHQYNGICDCVYLAMFIVIAYAGDIRFLFPLFLLCKGITQNYLTK